jgi:photosystem II stability/assembly factor-like uncharacterized protein
MAKSKQKKRKATTRPVTRSDVSPNLERPTRPRPRTRRPARRSKWRLWAGAALLAAAGVGLVMAGGNGGSPSTPFVGGDIHSLVADPGNPARLFVGGHQAVAVSTDRGRSWQQVETLKDADAMGWAFLDGRITVSGHPGLNVSQDGGRTFERRNEGLPATDVHAIGGTGSTLYGASPVVGVFGSTDGGASWQVITTEIGHSYFGRILVDADDPTHVVAADVSAGVIESTDGGRTWGRLGGLPGASWVNWDPSDPRHIVASRSDGAMQSSDGGQSWQPLNIPEGVWVVETSPHDPDLLFAAVHEGTSAIIWVSTNGGSTWSRP